MLSKSMVNRERRTIKKV